MNKYKLIVLIIMYNFDKFLELILYNICYKERAWWFQSICSKVMYQTHSVLTKSIIGSWQGNICIIWVLHQSYTCLSNSFFDTKTISSL